MKKLFSLNTAFLLVKVLSVAYTARDTYNVSQDLLAVALIDAMFLALWLVVAYGKGERMLQLRPFAAAGAGVMYAFIVAIGFEAHSNLQATVALACRVGIAVMLLHDAWDYVVYAKNRLQDVELRTTMQMFMQREDDKANRRAYKRSVSKLKQAEVQTMWNAVAEKRIANAANAVIAEQPVRVARDVTPRANTRNLILQPRLQAGYTLDANGLAICNVCNWRSEEGNDAGRSFSAHTRSRLHIANAINAMQIQEPEVIEVAITNE